MKKRIVFSHYGFWSGNFFLLAPFPDHCNIFTFFFFLFHSSRNEKVNSPSNMLFTSWQTYIINGEKYLTGCVRIHQNFVKKLPYSGVTVMFYQLVLSVPPSAALDRVRKIKLVLIGRAFIESKSRLNLVANTTLSCIHFRCGFAVKFSIFHKLVKQGLINTLMIKPN